jgi:hypothetical protein
MPANSHAASLGATAPAAGRERASGTGTGTGTGSEPAAVGVDYLVGEAGGEDVVLRDAYSRLPRVLRDANMLELTEAIQMALLDRAHGAFAQLGANGPRALHEAAAQLARTAVAARERRL